MLIFPNSHGLAHNGKTPSGHHLFLIRQDDLHPGELEEARERGLRRLVGDEPVDPFGPADLHQRVAVELARIGEHRDAARRLDHGARHIGVIDIVVHELGRAIDAAHGEDGVIGVDFLHLLDDLRTDRREGIARIAAAQQMDGPALRRGPHFLGHLHGIGDDGDGPAALRQLLGEEGGGAAAIEEEAVARRKELRRPPPDADLLGLRRDAPFPERAFQCRLHAMLAGGLGPAMDLAQQPLLGEERQVPPDRLPRGLEALRQIIDRHPGGLVHQVKDLAPPLCGSHFWSLCLFGHTD